MTGSGKPVRIDLTVNDEPRVVEVEPRWTLADVLRMKLGLTGTHLGCEHGICGACTVLVDGDPVRSCLTFAFQAQGCRVRTVESLGSPDDLSELQQAFADQHGLQCGFCTPGFLMLLQGWMDSRDPDTPPTENELLDVVASNLCRCTGYHGIMAAARQVAGMPQPDDVEPPVNED